MVFLRSIHSCFKAGGLKAGVVLCSHGLLRVAVTVFLAGRDLITFVNSEKLSKPVQG
jgi:hypothetical protein